MTLANITRRFGATASPPPAGGSPLYLPDPGGDDSDSTNYLGGYNSQYSYFIGNIVDYEGRYYTSLQDGNLSHDPPSPSWWEVTPYPEVGIIDFLGRDYDLANAFTNPVTLGNLTVDTSNAAASAPAATDHGSANDIVWIDNGGTRWWDCIFPAGTNLELESYKVRGKGPPGDNNHQLTGWNLYRYSPALVLTLIHSVGPLSFSSLWNGNWRTGEPGTVSECHGFRLEQVGDSSSGTPYMSFAEIEFFGTVSWT